MGVSVCGSSKRDPGVPQKGGVHEKLRLGDTAKNAFAPCPEGFNAGFNCLGKHVCLHSRLGKKFYLRRSVKNNSI